MRSLQALRKPIVPSHFGLSQVPNIFTLNEDADFANMCVLYNTPGEEIAFEAYNVGDKKCLNRGLTASENLALKESAQVAFIYNTNIKIVFKGQLYHL